ncbi:hypothetical protein Mbo2_013 [Rhodococcus phage Mbo2]|uniref:Uncharacterized protein n=1 Tax=Rhodococcus phage Mbo2 TaxID=2936911 RepID=A0A9E7IN22_9CAUD|nr:hypothetical protein Mbo2_013 [Rhodococcus phage Mbo2]
MASKITKNGDGKTATIKPTIGSTGGPNDSKGAPALRRQPLAQNTPRVAKRLPNQNKPVTRRQGH